MFSLKRPVQLYPKIPGAEFLRLLRDCALKMGTYEIADEDGAPRLSSSALLELDLLQHPRYSRVTIILVATRNSAAPVTVEVKADWLPPLDYDNYTRTVREVVGPLLDVYNRTHQARGRLGVPGPDKPAQLPAKASRYFQRYVSQANKWSLQDLGPFYDFVIHCHEFRVSLGVEELKELLVTNGFGEDQVVELAEVYTHGRALLKRRQRPRWLEE